MSPGNIHIELLLSDLSGFRWFGGNFCKVRGSFHDREGNYYSGEQMVEYFSSGDTFEDFITLVKQANGLFSVMKLFAGECWLSTDLVRSLPLFYARSSCGWLVADTTELILQKLGGFMKNEQAWLEFSGTGYVTGRETLATGISQVQAGEVVRLGTEAAQNFHHSYRTNSITGLPVEGLRLEALTQFEDTFSRLVNSLEGRTAVIPLSGGFDSRLIAVMLKSYGYTNVVCFTYGRKGNEEAAISERVARRLGFNWYFVEYNPLTIGDYLEDPAFRDYYPWASNLTSMFFLQEYFAVKYLGEQGLIPDDAVFIPGHSGDFLGGSQFAKHQLPEEDEDTYKLVNRILGVKYQYAHYRKTEQRVLRDRIHAQLSQKQVTPKGGGEALSYSVHEDWDLKEKLAKFNVNSASVYTFFGYSFRLPYYDRDLVNFFRDLPVDMKRDKSLYDDLLVNNFFIPEDVYFEKELQMTARDYSIARFRKSIKRFVPGKLLDMRPRKADLLYYREITEQLRNDLRRRGGTPAAYGSRYNKMIIDWYLFTLQDKFSG